MGGSRQSELESMSWRTGDLQNYTVSLARNWNRQVTRSATCESTTFSVYATREI